MCLLVKKAGESPALSLGLPCSISDLIGGISMNLRPVRARSVVNIALFDLLAGLKVIDKRRSRMNAWARVAMLKINFRSVRSMFSSPLLASLHPTAEDAVSYGSKLNPAQST